jgi:hypothetical protein
MPRLHTVCIASSAFVAAASAQAEVLGMPDVRYVFVPHPIQDAAEHLAGAQSSTARTLLASAARC